MWSGTWGILRAYRDAQNNLFELPNNAAGDTEFANAADFNGVCPINATVASYDVSAVLANQALPNDLNVTIPDNVAQPGPDGLLGTEDDILVGTGLDPAGGTLVYNRRQTVVPDATVVEGGVAHLFKGGAGPLNDPTAIMYAMTSDLEVIDPSHPGCTGEDPVTGDMVPSDEHPDPVILPTCPARLKVGAPVEPVVLRANAGDCIEVVLRNRLPAVAPDLAGWQGMMWVVNRELFEPQDMRGNEMHFFNNNLIRPSSHVGLHPQLVAYDVNQHDGVQVGTVDDFDEEFQLAPPGGAKEYRWYAGDISFVAAPDQCNGNGNGNGGGGNNNGEATCVKLIATPVEFGGTNLLSADRVKQPQKGLFGALVIEPDGATYDETTLVADSQGTGAATRLTRAQADISSLPGAAGSGGNYREALAIGHKITNLRWKDGSAIKNVNQEEMGREGAEDSGHAGFNYGMEPPWFRFKLPPNVPWGNAGQANTYGAIPNQHAFYANQLVTDGNHPNYIPAIEGVSADGDPVTPVFRAPAGQPARMHVLNGASADRDGTWMLHGHLWQRDPFVCTGADQDDYVSLVGRCDPDAVASQALGVNPQGKWMATEEGMGHAYGHWPILLQSAGGSGAVPGDYLYRDYAPNGNRNGQFGILRVE
jgi:hypothetical protein